MKKTVFHSLSSPQLSIWYTEKMFPGTSIANIAGTLRIKEKIDFDLMSKAVQLLIKNNEGMRLRVCLDKSGNPQQYVSDYKEKSVEIKDFSEHKDPIKAMYEWNSQESLIPFDLIDHDLYRVFLVKLGISEGAVFSNFHHIISDAWSASVACSIAMDYYKKLKNPETDILQTNNSNSYLSFIEGEKQYRESKRFEKDKDYWERTFETLPEVTVLKTRKTKLVFTESKRKTFVAPIKFVSKLREYCSENKITPYPLFISALAMYINRVIEKDDIIIGTPILNRTKKAERNTVGMFISTVPLRIYLKDSDSFASFSKDVNELVASVYRHQKYPYDHILRQVRDKFGITDNLYDIVLSYQNVKFLRNDDMDSSTRWHFNGHQSNSLTIHINDRDDEGSLIIDYDYQADMYYDKEIDFIHQHLISFLWHALDNPDKEICKIEMLPESEKRKILYEFNDTVADYPKEKTIHQLFEEQVERTPENIALVFEDKQLTYRELNEKANSLARVLRAKGVKTDQVVGVYVRRSFEMVICLLSALKAGAAFIPIAPDCPVERIKHMVEDSNVCLLLTDKTEIKQYLNNENLQCLDPFVTDNYFENSYNLDSQNVSSDLAYIIYTSGSTGEPKGAMLEHKSLVNFAYGLREKIDYGKIERVMSVTSISFDVFLLELIPSLFKGVTIVIANGVERKDPLLLANLIKRNQIDLFVCTPSQMRYFILNKEFCSSLKGIYEIVLAGEHVPEDLLESLRNNTKALVLNGYGPTETTVLASTKELTNAREISIGKPMDNVAIYILDKNLLPVPIGVTGEIYIGGVGVGRGYINKDELTSQMFIQNPFMQGTKLYKSGDLGRWYPGGDIRCLGRTDYQVKIRGMRIELGEIEKRMLTINEIEKAFVTVIDNENSKKICVYYVASSNIDVKQIKEYLLKYLPPYMVPTYYVKVNNIPLSANGKIDIRLLPEPEQSVDCSRNHVLPQSNIEKEILSMWQDTLSDYSIGITDDFFDIGGDSLSIIQIATKLYAKYSINIPISFVSEISNVQKMAQYILECKSAESVSCEANEALIKIKDGGGTNLFLIHAGNGEINSYNELGNLIADDVSVWGIRFVEKDLSNLIDIPLLANKYIRYIMETQPKGPYLLGGWCLGGSIAFEMARILEQKGNVVGFLGLINSIAPHNWEKGDLFTDKDEHKLLKMLLSKCSDDSTKFNGISTEQMWSVLNEKIITEQIDIKTVLGYIPNDVRRILPVLCYSDPKAFTKYMRSINILHKARTGYYPENKLDKQVYFFSALYDKNIKDYKANLNEWNKYCKKEIISYEIKSDHYELLSQPSVNKISEVINSRLQFKNQGYFNE